MISNTLIAIAIKPIVLPIFFFAIVAPIAWMLYHLFPNGRLKVVLFRQRSGPSSSGWDAVLMCIAVLLAYVALGCEILILASR